MANEEHAEKAKTTPRLKGPLQRHPYLVLLGAVVVLLLVLILVVRFFIPALLLSSVVALICCWNHLDALKRGIGIAAIVLVALMCWWISGENADVTFVKEGHWHYPYTRIGEAVEQFMRGARWKAVTEEGTRYVEVRGRATYKGEKVKVVLRFRIIDREKGLIKDEYLTLNETRLSAIDRSNFLAQVFTSFKRS